MSTAQDDSVARVAQATAEGRLSEAAAANIRRWLTEPPFAPYRDRLIADPDAVPGRRSFHAAPVWRRSVRPR